MDSCTFAYRTSFNDKTKCSSHSFTNREGIDLDDMLYEFEMFLQGAGFMFEGHLDFIVKEEDLNEEIEETSNEKD